MSEELITIKLSNGNNLSIEVIRKMIKNIRLRICTDGRMSVSVPIGIDHERIQEFVSSKSAWIEKHIANQMNHRLEEGHFLFMGKCYSVEIVKDRRTGVALSDGKMTVFCGNPQEYKSVLIEWWERQALSYLKETADKWFPVLHLPESERPVIKIRKMKTLWGSCTKEQHTIRFNYYLMCAPTECIEYVVFHELAHLLYSDHGADFKAFLTDHMPDWKERRRLLNLQSAGFRLF